MKPIKLLALAGVCFLGVGVALYFLMRTLGGDDVPCLYLVGMVVAFAALFGWVGKG